MSRPLTVKTKPALTVFHTDPSTGSPYLSVAHAENMARVHIRKYAQNVLKRMDAEDLKQELMAKLCASRFDPTKSAAKTFAITCFGGTCGNIWKRLHTAGERFRERPDFVVMNEDGEVRMATEVDAEEDDSNPERLLIMKQELGDMDLDEQCNTRNWHRTSENRRKMEALLND